jgi:hypothetical protein
LPHDTKYRTETPDQTCGFIMFRSGQPGDQLAITILALKQSMQLDLIFATMNLRLGFLKDLVSGLHR